MDLHASGQTKAVVHELLLKLREAGVGVTLFQSPEEVLVRLVEIAERLLGRALAHLVEPWEVGLLESVELPVLFDRVREPRLAFPCPLELLTPSERPVPGEPLRAGVLREKRALLARRLEFEAVGLVREHEILEWDSTPNQRLL